MTAILRWHINEVNKGSWTHKYQVDLKKIPKIEIKKPSVQQDKVGGRVVGRDDV